LQNYYFADNTAYGANKAPVKGLGHRFARAKKTGGNYILINYLRSFAIGQQLSSGYILINHLKSFGHRTPTVQLFTGVTPNIFDCLFMMRFTVITDKSHKGQSPVQWFSLC